MAEFRAHITKRPYPPSDWNLPFITLTAGMNLGWAESEIMAYVYLCLRRVRRVHRLVQPHPHINTEQSVYPLMKCSRSRVEASSC